MYVQNANVIFKFTWRRTPTLIMHEYLVENENIKNIQNYQNYIYQLYYKAKYLNLGSKNSSGEHGEISGCP